MKKIILSFSLCFLITISGVNVIFAKDNKPLLFGLSWGCRVPPDSIVERYDVLGLDACRYKDARRLKSAFPGLKVFTYKCMSSSRSGISNSVDGLMPTGVDYYKAPEEWFAHDSAGKRLEWKPYKNHWQMMVGITAYQQMWLSNVSSELPRNGWDGTFIDNTNRLKVIYGNKVYASDDESAAATRSFLGNVALPLRNAGLIVVANVEAGRLKPGLWSDWAQFCTGLFEEHWMGWNGYLHRECHTTSDGIGGYMREVEEALAKGTKVFVRIHTEFGRPGIAYRFGVLRLCADVEKDAYTEADGKDPGKYPELLMSLGTPDGKRYVIQDGVYGRDFQKGKVIVNANPSNTLNDYDLGGSYKDADGNNLTNVTLKPLTAIHLRKNSTETKPLLFALWWGGRVPPDSIAAKLDILGMDAWRFKDAQRLKSIFPHLKVFTYKCIASTRSNPGYSVGGVMSTGVDYKSAPEEWFAHDTLGKRFDWVPYKNCWQMLVETPGYQQKWLSNVSDELPKNGWDGTFMDNANRFKKIYGRQVYKTDDESEAATLSFLQNVALPLRNSGLIAVANVEAGRLKPGLWSDWAPFCTGLFEEHWMGWNGYLHRECHTTSDGIGGYMREVEEALAKGTKVFVRIHTEFGRPGVAYRFGALRLCADVEKDAYTEADGKDPGKYPELAMSLGSPTGARYVIQDGVYGRDFQNGKVIVNANASNTLSDYNLGGTYIDADGNQLKSVTIASLTAIHLKKNGQD